MKPLHKLLSMLCAFVLAAGLCVFPSHAAPDWPEGIEIAAEGGILIDATSGAMLYGKNIHAPYYPASITKILTALIVIENCELNEIVTFSHDAVFNVEAGSSSAALDVGDKLPVRDCLYAMLLKSANEAANALAEHTAGSVSDFAEMMNARAAELGCTDSHFNNPSGLNDPAHYTSAHDMALIAQAAFQNEIFVEIDSTLYFDLPVTLRNPEGLRIYPGHRMLKKNAPQYYPGIIGGKTGYTSLAGNTLVTCAERNGLKLITVVLNGHQTHYTDTRAMLNFGFQNFKSVNAADIGTAYTSMENDMTIAGLPTTDLSVLQLEESCKIVLPSSADYADVTSMISYDLPANAPDQAVAQISYQYNSRPVGSTYLLLNKDGPSASEPMADMAKTALPGAGVTPSMDAAYNAPWADSGDAAQSPDPTDSPRPKFHIMLPKIHIPPKILTTGGIVIGLAALSNGLVFLIRRAKEREKEEALARRNRRQQRLQDIGMSTAEFDLLLEQRRSASAIPLPKHPLKRPKKHKSFLDHKSYKDV